MVYLARLARLTLAVRPSGGFSGQHWRVSPPLLVSSRHFTARVILCQVLACAAVPRELSLACVGLQRGLGRKFCPNWHLSA